MNEEHLIKRYKFMRDYMYEDYLNRVSSPAWSETLTRDQFNFLSVAWLDAIQAKARTAAHLLGITLRIWPSDIYPETDPSGKPQ